MLNLLIAQRHGLSRRDRAVSVAEATDAVIGRADVRETRTAAHLRGEFMEHVWGRAGDPLANARRICSAGEKQADGFGIGRVNHQRAGVARVAEAILIDDACHARAQRGICFSTHLAHPNTCVSTRLPNFPNEFAVRLFSRPRPTPGRPKISLSSRTQQGSSSAFLRATNCGK